MRVEDITVAVRPRAGWESVDLGFTMVRQWWRPIFGSFFCVVLPVAVILNAILIEHLWLAGVLMWWLKPMFDRIPLYIVSHGVFGSPPTVKQTLRALPSLMKFHVIKALTIYRFDLARSFNLPVWQLEQLKGKARSERVRVLHKNTRNTAMKLTIAGLHMEMALVMALFALVFVMIPNHMLEQAWHLFQEPDVVWIEAMGNGLALIGMCVIEPFYVAGGFALYINRRTHLEAWDIELAFRRIDARLRPAPAGGPLLAGIVAVVLLGSLAGVGLSRDAFAQESQTVVTELTHNEAKTLINEVMGQPEFNREKEITHWVPKKDEQEDTEPSGFDFNLFGFGVGMARVIEVLMWIGVVIIAALLLYYFLRWLPGFPWVATGRRARTRHAIVQGDALFGLDIRPESLPEDVAKEAWRLWCAAEHTAALSLLYRAALAELVYHRGIQVPVSATEGDCIRTVRAAKQQLGQDAAMYFERLTHSWQAVAYAKHPPDERTVEALCQDWTHHFQART